MQISFFKKFFLDFWAYFISKIVPAGFSFLMIILFARLLTPKDYGSYSILLLLATFSAAIFGQWIEQCILRFIPELEDENGKSFIFQIYKKNSIKIFLPLLFFLGYLGYKYSQSYILSALLVLLAFNLIFYNSFKAYFQSTLNSKTFTLNEIILAISKLAAPLFLLMILGIRIEYIFLGLAISYFFINAWIFKKNFAEKRLMKSYQINNLKLLKYGLPLAGWFVGAQLLNFADRFLIEYYLGKSEVGIYTANYDILNKFMQFLSLPFLMAFHPLIIKYYNKESENNAKLIIHEFSKIFIVITIPVLFFISAYSSEISNLIFSAKYSDGAKIFPFVLLGLFFWNFSMFGQKVYELTLKTKKLLFYLLIALMANLVLNIIFIPNYGIVAAAVTTLIGTFLYMFLIFIGAPTNFKWKIPFKEFALITTISLIVFLITKNLVQSGSLIPNKGISFTLSFLIWLFSFSFIFFRIKQHKNILLEAKF